MHKEDWERLWLHTPWGILAGWIFFGSPLPWLIPINATLPSVVAGSLILISEFTYEAFNDWRKQDKSYKDVLGIVWGFIIIVMALSILVERG